MIILGQNLAIYAIVPRQIVNLMDEKSILRLFALQCTENIVSSIISHIRFRLALYVNYD